MIIQRTPLSAALPFDLSVVETHCRADFDPSFDIDLARMAAAAAHELEAYAQIALLNQTITVTLEDALRRSVFDLPIAPVIDPLLVGVTVDGAAFDDFAVITGQRPALRFTNGKPCGLVVIQYLAGFGDSAADLPQDIENAIADQAAAFFDMRGVGDGKTNGMSPHMARVAARYRRVSI